MFGGGSPGREADPGGVVPFAGEGVASLVGVPSAPPVSVFPFVLLPPETDEGAPVLLEGAGVAWFVVVPSAPPVNAFPCVLPLVLVSGRAF